MELLSMPFVCADYIRLAEEKYTEDSCAAPLFFMCFNFVHCGCKIIPTMYSNAGIEAGAHTEWRGSESMGDRIVSSVVESAPRSSLLTFFYHDLWFLNYL